MSAILMKTLIRLELYHQAELAVRHEVECSSSNTLHISLFQAERPAVLRFICEIHALES